MRILKILCEDMVRYIDIESISKLINQSLKDKIQNEAEENNFKTELLN